MDPVLALSRAHMAQQVRDVAAVQAALSVAFDRAIQPADLDTSFPTFLRYAVTLITAARSRGTLSADRFYASARLLADLGATVPDALPPVLDLDSARTALEVNGPIKIKQQIGKGVEAAAATTSAKKTTLAVAKRLVLASSRDRLVSLTHADKDALGWARVTDGKPCHFCAMLVSRGPVYSENTARFEAHNGCGCNARPVFRGASDRGWSEDAAAYRDLWKENPDPQSFRSALRKSQADPESELAKTVVSALAA